MNPTDHAVDFSEYAPPPVPILDRQPGKKAFHRQIRHMGLATNKAVITEKERNPLSSKLVPVLLDPYSKLVDH